MAILYTAAWRYSRQINSTMASAITFGLGVTVHIKGNGIQVGSLDNASTGLANSGNGTTTHVVAAIDNTWQVLLFRDTTMDSGETLHISLNATGTGIASQSGSWIPGP